MRTPAQRALIFGIAISAVCLLLHWLGVGLPLLAVLAAVFALVAIVTAARHSGYWQHDNEGAVQVRVDGIAAHLSTMPDRMEPRIIRLRRYLERELLFPAAERRRRR